MSTKKIVKQAPVKTTVSGENRRPNKAIEYVVIWRWSFESVYSHDHVHATTAPRALAKLYKRLDEEYEYSKADVTVRSIFPADEL